MINALDVARLITIISYSCHTPNLCLYPCMASGRKYWPITNDDVYVRVFNEILCEIDPNLLDLDLIQSFQSLSTEAQYIVTRLYLRKSKWIRLTDLENYLPYEKLKDSVIPELTLTQWVQDKPSTIQLISDVASQKELVEVSKSLGLKAPSSNRAVLAGRLIELEKQQRAMRVISGTSTKIGNALQVECCQLDESKRVFLFKLEQIFLYPAGPDATLEVIYLTHMKKLSFLKYEYETQRTAPIFTSKEEFEAYAKARSICIPVEEALAVSAQKIPKSVLSEDNLKSIEQGLTEAKKLNFPQALRVYGRGIFNLSQVFMKAHRFREEYDWIKKYLHDSGHRGKRGLSLIRKLLLEIRFLQETGSVGDNMWLFTAVNTYYDALAEVSEIERLDLERKTSKLVTVIRNTGLQSALSAIHSTSQPDLIKFKFPTNEIIAAPVKSEGAPTTPGTRLTYEEGYLVEKTALLQYKEFEGRHYENSMMLTILWLLIYDLLFNDPAQFRCAYQSHPMQIQKALDDNKQAIEERLLDIKETVIKNRRYLERTYPNDPKPYVGSVNWLISEENIISVIEGLGNEKTKLILSRIVSNYFQFSSGFPDLTLWRNGDSPHTKFVEVKSENDTVSDNQILWIKFLLDNDIDVEICKVIPTKKVPKRKRSKA